MRIITRLITKKQWQRYKELELISAALPSQPLAAPATHRSTSWLRALWNAIDLALLRNLEPRVWQKIDHNGKLRWYLYDPATGKTRSLSDAEVRCWLEQVFRH